MTRQEIEQQLIADNPSTRIDGVEYLPGTPQYDDLLAQWADAMEGQQALAADAAKEAAFQAAIAAGHTVTEGWTFALGDQDRINWDQYAAHHERKLARNQVTLTDFAPMIDITGTARVVTVERMLEIVVEIGDAYQAAFFARHS